MRNRDAWLAAIAAAMGISEEACRREAAPQIQQVASAAASSSAPVALAIAPSASADTTPSATASAAPSASASVVKPASTANPFANADPLQGICGAMPDPMLNGACGARAFQTQPGTIPSGVGIGRIGQNAACGGGTAPQPTVASPRAEVTLNVSGGGAGDDHIATNLRPRFRACANQALRQDPTQQGKLVVSVKIAANGEVSSADVMSNSGLSAASAQCMTRMVKNAQFAAGTPRTLVIAITQTKQSP